MRRAACWGPDRTAEHTVLGFAKPGFLDMGMLALPARTGHKNLTLCHPRLVLSQVKGCVCVWMIHLACFQSFPEFSNPEESFFSKDMF